MAKGGLQSYFSSGLGFGAEEGLGLNENQAFSSSRRDATSKEAGHGAASRSSTSSQADSNPRFAVPESDQGVQRKVHRYARKGPPKTSVSEKPSGTKLGDDASRSGGNLSKKTDTPADDLQSKRAAAAAAAYTASLTNRRGANGAVGVKAASVSANKEAASGFQRYSANGSSARDQEVPALGKTQAAASTSLSASGGPRYGAKSSSNARYEGLNSIRATYAEGAEVKAEEKRPEATGISSFLDLNSPPPEVPTFFDAFADASMGKTSNPVGLQSANASSDAGVSEANSKEGQSFSLFSDQPLSAEPSQQSSSQSAAQAFRRRPFATMLRQQQADGLAQGLNQLNLSQQQRSSNRPEQQTPFAFGAQASRDGSESAPEKVPAKPVKAAMPAVASKQPESSSLFQNPPETLFGQKPVSSPMFDQSPSRVVPPQGILPFVFSAGSSGGGSVNSRNERDPSPSGEDAESSQLSQSFAERLRLAKSQEGVASSMEGLRGFLFKGSVVDEPKESKQSGMGFVFKGSVVDEPKDSKQSPFQASHVSAESPLTSAQSPLMSAESPQMSAKSPRMSASPQTVPFVAFGSTGSSPGTPAKRKSELKSVKKASPSNRRTAFNPTRTLPRTPLVKPPMPAKPKDESIGKATERIDETSLNRNIEAESVRVDSPQPMDISPGRESWEDFEQVSQTASAGLNKRSSTTFDEKDDENEQFSKTAEPGGLRSETPKRQTGSAQRRFKKTGANGLRASASYDGDLEEDSSSSEPAADKKASDWARKWEPPKQPYDYDSSESDSQSDGEISPEVWAKGEAEKLERLKKTAMEGLKSSDEESGQSEERVEQLGAEVEEMELTSVGEKEQESDSGDELESVSNVVLSDEPVGGDSRGEDSGKEMGLSRQEGSVEKEKAGGIKCDENSAAAFPAAPFVFGAKQATYPQASAFGFQTESLRGSFSPSVNESPFVFASASTSPKFSPRRVPTLRKSTEALRRSHEKRRSFERGKSEVKQPEASAPTFSPLSVPPDAKAGSSGPSESIRDEAPKSVPVFAQNTAGDTLNNTHSTTSPPPKTAEVTQSAGQPPKTPGQVRRARRMGPNRSSEKEGIPFTKLTAGSPEAMDEDNVQRQESRPAHNHVCYHKSPESLHRTSRSAAKEGLSAANETGSNGPVLTASISQLKAGATCERWRLKGNQAYTSKDYKGAETLYTKGVEAVFAHEGIVSPGCAGAAALCLSNRAAVRMVLGRVREALADCRSAAEADPGFTKVRLRAASCHLMLGEYATASALYAECKSMGDAKATAEASEGLSRTSEAEALATKVAELLQSQELLTLSAESDTEIANMPFKQVPAHTASEALKLLSESMAHSPQSEALLEMKALTLLWLRKFEEAISFCETSLSSSARNSGPKNVRMWGLRVSVLAQYHLGKIEEADELAEKVELEAREEVAASEESVAGLRALIKELLKHKAAGNAAFQAGKREAAVEHYSAALACNSSSRPFNAVCLANRAAAYQALGSIAEAIADCSRAIVLDPGYAKALSRRATLHELIRDHSESVRDLERLSAILTARQKSGPRNAQLSQEIKAVVERKKIAQESAQKEAPVDHYKILGVEKEGGEAEIKKAYRRAALRHHPDKAVQFLSTLKDDDKADMTEEIHREAERLFKLIGEAYNVLSNPSKRMAYDMDEEDRSYRTSMRGYGRSNRSNPFPRNRAGRGSATNSWSNVRPPFDPDWADEFFGRKGRSSREEHTADYWDTDFY